MGEPVEIETIGIPTKYRIDAQPEDYDQRRDVTRQLLEGLSEHDLIQLRNTAYVRFIRTFQKLRRCNVCKIEVQTATRCDACTLNAKRVKRAD